MEESNSGAYAIRTDAVRDLEASLARTVADIRRELYVLSIALDRLSNEWSGEASAAYVEAQRTWLRTTEEMARLLHASGSAAGTTVTRHLEARERVAALWRK